MNTYQIEIGKRFGPDAWGVTFYAYAESEGLAWRELAVAAQRGVLKKLLDEYDINPPLTKQSRFIYHEVEEAIYPLTGQVEMPKTIYWNEIFVEISLFEMPFIH